MRGWSRDHETARTPAVLLLAHTGRAEAREVARACVRALTEHGIAVRLLAAEANDLELDPGPGGDAGLVETTGPTTARARAASWRW